MEIGVKIRELRLKNQLTQEELADRCDLTKGYISQLENDGNSPSIATLKDILDCLGCSLTDFFADEQESVVFTEEDTFVKESDGCLIRWLVPSSLKNAMEPILMTLSPRASSGMDLPHEGEEFGFVLDGEVRLKLGKNEHTVRAGDSFYFRSGKSHRIENVGKGDAKILWVSCPPNF
ncbi:MAG: cupin domain-containing protein [Clostridia bacterium]|nr:cupin domain-containing protein [Clostridia bacterium]